MTPFLISAFGTFLGMMFLLPLILSVARLFGLYTIVNERTCRVYVLFGKVIGSLSEPGLHFLPSYLGFNAFIVNFFGRCRVLDLRLDQEYRRSEAGEFRRRRAHGHRHLVRDVDQRSGGISVQEHRSARLPARQRKQCHRALLKQYAAGGNAPNAT